MVLLVGHGVTQTKKSRDRFPVDHSGVKNGIHPQMLRCHNGIQVCSPIAIVKIKKQRSVLTGYNAYRAMYVHEFFMYRYTNVHLS